MVVALLAVPKLPLAGPPTCAHCQLTSVALLSAVRVRVLPDTVEPDTPMSTRGASARLTAAAALSMPAPQVVVVQLHWPSLVTVGQVGSAGSAGNAVALALIDHLITGADVQLEEVGPVFATIRINRSFLNSSLSQKMRIYNGMPRVDYITSIDWHEQGTAKTDAPMLKTTFTPFIGSSVATFETPFAPLVRPADGRECPALRWADVGDGEYGLSLMNNCKYGYSAHGNTLSLTLVRSSYEPDNHPDEGMHELIYSIYPYKGSWQEAGSDRRAAELNQPMITTVTTAHQGKLKPSQPCLELDSAGVMVSAFKLAEHQPEEGSDYILRLYEAHGRATSCSLSLCIPCHQAFMSNILEAALSPLPLTDGKLSLELRPYEIVTLLFHSN